MKNLTYLVLGVVSMLLVQACHERRNKNYNKEILVDAKGLKFLKDGMEDCLTDVKASGVAITNSSNQRVIRFAKMIIDDHTQAENELKKIENDKWVDEKDTINVVHQEIIDDLSQKTGRSFDKAYLKMMEADHEKTIKLLASAMANNEEEIKSFKKKTLPTIQMHLDSAKAILVSLK